MKTLSESLSIDMSELKPLPLLASSTCASDSQLLLLATTFSESKSSSSLLRLGEIFWFLWGGGRREEARSSTFWLGMCEGEGERWPAAFRKPGELVTPRWLWAGV